MQNNVKKQHLYLSGGGNEDQSFPLDKLFFEDIPIGGKFLYIPIALRGHQLYSGASSWMRNVVDKHNRKDITFDTPDDLRSVVQSGLTSYDAIYIGGGNTWLLMQEMRQSGFDKLLNAYTLSNGSIYGGSAGAIVLGQRIDTQDDPNDSGVDNVRGVNILSGYSLACHFKHEQSERFVNWAETNHLPILGLPEDAGLIVSEDRATCVGGSFLLFTPNKETREITPGESIPLL